MSRDLYEFTWLVTPDGYAWQHQKAPAHSEWVLRWPHMGGTKGRVYQPLRECTGLFRTFAFTRPDRDSILAFAKRFGRLGCGTVEIREEGMDPEQKGRFIDFAGEPLHIWMTQIRTMRRLVRLWDACCENDVTALAAVIQWKGKSEVWYKAPAGKKREPDLDPDCPTVEEPIATPTHDGSSLEHFQPGDVFAPALFYLQGQVNRQLALMPVRLVWQADEARLRRRLIPESLEAALWLQFVEAIDGQKKYRACKKCGLWFELSPKIARTSRHFCSGNCRNRAYLERQDQARDLHRKGKSFKEIALVVGTDAATVRNWVRVVKKKTDA